MNGKFKIYVVLVIVLILGVVGVMRLSSRKEKIAAESQSTEESLAEETRENASSQADEITAEPVDEDVNPQEEADNSEEEDSSGTVSMTIGEEFVLELDENQDTGGF